MNKNEVVKTKKILKRLSQTVISVRVSKDLKAWLDKNDFSYAKIFLRACTELGYEDD